MNIIIETPRLLIRPFTAGDASLIQALNSEPAVLQYIPEPVIDSEEKALEILTTIILPQYHRKLGRWAVVVKDNNQFIGWCGLKWLEPSGEIDLGYRYLPAAWGKGYATEAAARLLTYGFEQLGLPKIIAHAHRENVASQKVLEKIGMTLVGEGMEDGVPLKGYVAYNPRIK